MSFIGRTRGLAANSSYQCPRPASLWAQLMVCLTMADVPPWPNFSFNGTTLLCPIITGILLMIFPPAIAGLLDCHYQSGGTLLHHQRRTVPHCHQQRKKDSTAATSALMIELTNQLETLTEMNAILQGQVNARAAVAPATSFARTPAFRGQYDLLDFSKKVDLSVYKEGKTPVLEVDNCFDLKPEKLGPFLRMLAKKATDQGCNVNMQATHSR